MNTIGKLTIILALVALSTGCKDEKADYIRLSNNSFTFTPEGDEVFTVTVDAGGKWATTISGTWFTIEQEDSNTLVITATPTRSNGIRKGQIMIASGLAEEVIDLTQLGTNVVFNKLELHSQEFIMSPNGKYIGAVEVEFVNSIYSYIPYIIEAATGEVTKMEPLDEMYDVSAISDTGLLVITEFNKSSKFYNSGNELTDVKMPAGFSSAIVSGISSDGSVFVGFGRNGTDKLYYPIKWTNNEPVLLDMPRESTYGKIVTQGTMARGCSADGSVIYGSCWDDFAAVYWKGTSGWQYVGGAGLINRHDLIIDLGGGDYRQIEVVDRPILMADNFNMSSSGKYLGFSYRVTVAKNREEVTIQYPSIFNTETGEYEILRTLPGSFTTGWGWTTSDSGHLSFSCPQGSTFIGYVYDMNTGVTLSTSDYVRDEYGFMLQQEESYIRQFVGGGESIMGGTYLFGGSSMEFWYMTLSEL